MRIIGGTHRGRNLIAPKGRSVRPTSDRARESIFNMLDNGVEGVELEGANVLDVFAGSGAFGLEALSRGAAHATLIDNSPQALAAAKENAAILGEWRKVRQIKLDATKLPPPPRAARCPASIAFLDPPYEQELVLPALLGLHGKGWITNGSLCIVEISTREEFEPPAGYTLVDERKYGAARVLFLIRNK